MLSELGFWDWDWGFLGLGKNWGTDMWNADGQDVSGVLCFSLGSRLRGNDGGCLNRGLR